MNSITKLSLVAVSAILAGTFASATHNTGTTPAHTGTTTTTHGTGTAHATTPTAPTDHAHASAQADQPVHDKKTDTTTHDATKTPKTLQPSGAEKPAAAKK